jgi:hypothetical protein
MTTRRSSADDEVPSGAHVPDVPSRSLSWVRMICLHGDLARAEPKKLRYCLLHAAGVVARTGRRTRLRIAQTWPWVTDLVTAFERVRLTAQRS